MPTNSDKQRELSHEEQLVVDLLTSMKSLRNYNVESVKKSTDKIDWYLAHVLKQASEEFIKEINEIHTSL